MAFKVLFIPTKRCLEDADKIDSFALSETEIIKVIGKGAFASAASTKHNGEEAVIKEMLCKHWDEGKKFLKKGQNSDECQKLHKYVTSVKKVCYWPFVIMMHCSSFSFSPFSAAINENVKS